MGVAGAVPRPKVSSAMICVTVQAYKLVVNAMSRVSFPFPVEGGGSGQPSQEGDFVSSPGWPTYAGSHPYPLLQAFTGLTRWDGRKLAWFKYVTIESVTDLYRHSTTECMLRSAGCFLVHGRIRLPGVTMSGGVINPWARLFAEGGDERQRQPNQGDISCHLGLLNPYS